MGQAAARFCLSLVAAMQGEAVIEYTYVQVDGSDDAAFFAHPVRLGANGVEEILPYGDLSDFEENAKNSMLEGLRGDIKMGVDFVNG
jgi:malate dehydrogenase